MWARSHIHTRTYTCVCAHTHAHTCRGAKPEWGLARGGMSFLEAGGLPAPKATGQVATRGRAWRPARTELSFSDHHSDPGHIHGDLHKPRSQWLPCPTKSIRGQRHPTVGGGSDSTFLPRDVGPLFSSGTFFPSLRAAGRRRQGQAGTSLAEALRKASKPPPTQTPLPALPPPPASAPWPQGLQLTPGSRWGREQMVQGQP